MSERWLARIVFVADGLVGVGYGSFFILVALLRWYEAIIPEEDDGCSARCHIALAPADALTWGISASIMATMGKVIQEAPKRVRLVDLFCGCGAMSLGAAEAVREADMDIDICWAIDIDPDAAAVFRANFHSAVVEAGPIERHLDGGLRSAFTPRERALQSLAGRVDILLGGPPCQGHSNLNNHTRRSDPRNAVYRKMARAARVFRPAMVLIENVPTVRYDARQVVKTTRKMLEGSGYLVDDRVVDASTLGVPQRRLRHVVLGLQGKDADPSVVLDMVDSADKPRTTVRDAIENLLEVEPRTRFDTASHPSTKNQERMDWLLENDEYDLPNYMRPPCHATSHTYPAVYGRLHWNLPAPTITTGFNSMGQGRYVHPSLARTITPHEAARLQSIPDNWDFSGARSRRSLAKLIGNAVPPPLTRSVVAGVLSLYPGLLVQPAQVAAA